VRDPGGPRVTARELVWSSLGLGMAPVASGTFGTLGGVALAAVALLLPPGLPVLLFLVGAAVVVTLVGLPLGDAAERHYGRKDPKPFVLDEVAGYLVTLVGHGLHARPYLVLGGAFFLFRATDVIKPWPARRLERLPGGLGIMVDDLAAGVWANVLLWGLVALA